MYICMYAVVITESFGRKKYLENLCFVYLTRKVGKPIDQIVNITLDGFSLAIH